jgi:prepilin-type N-terminal cleavage/methylation domain-containing protein
MKSLFNKGFSLIETLVVIGLFAIVAAVISQATAVSLTGSRKSDASTQVRENLSSAVGSIERQIRSARSVSCTSSERIDYIDQEGNGAYFACYPSASCNSATSTYIASASATPLVVSRITSTDTVCIVACEFSCTVPASGLPPTVEVTIVGQSKDVAGVENTSIELKTSVTLRAY